MLKGGLPTAISAVLLKPGCCLIWSLRGTASIKSNGAGVGIKNKADDSSVKIVRRRYSIGLEQAVHAVGGPVLPRSVTTIYQHELDIAYSRENVDRNIAELAAQHNVSRSY